MEEGFTQLGQELLLGGEKFKVWVAGQGLLGGLFPQSLSDQGGFVG